MLGLNGIMEVQNGEGQLLVAQLPAPPSPSFYLHENLVRLPGDLAVIKSSARTKPHSIKIQFNRHPCSVVFC